ncbi:Arf11p [Salvia divinorum]|uniref:Arf11p n=1 Tax=Salvia divinorum TaxID=28513 RepID=A0ABD1GJ24_SALDI
MLFLGCVVSWRHLRIKNWDYDVQFVEFSTFSYWILIAKDRHGNEWQFNHIFRVAGESFCVSKVLIDVKEYMKGGNGELWAEVRRHARSPTDFHTLSSQSMHFRVLATASHAVMTQTIFLVYYKPGTSQFIVDLKKYLEAINHDFGVGMRFKMQFEGDEGWSNYFSAQISRTTEERTTASAGEVGRLNTGGGIEKALLRRTHIRKQVNVAFNCPFRGARIHLSRGHIQEAASGYALYSHPS